MNETRIKDLGIAAILKTLSFPLVRVENGLENGKQFSIFVFSDTETNTIDSVMTNYWSGNCLVEAKKMLESLRDLKTLIHQMNFN